MPGGTRRGYEDEERCGSDEGKIDNVE